MTLIHGSLRSIMRFIRIDTRSDRRLFLSMEIKKIHRDKILILNKFPLRRVMYIIFFTISSTLNAIVLIFIRETGMPVK